MGGASAAEGEEIRRRRPDGGGTACGIGVLGRGRGCGIVIGRGCSGCTELSRGGCLLLVIRW